MDDKMLKTLHLLQAQCSRREYCSTDIRRKALERLDGDAEAASDIIENLKADKFVDDLRYASAFAREKASLTGWGAIKIRFALSAKGIASELIDSALADIDETGASDRLRKMLDLKWKSLEGDPQARLKLIKFGLTRGYPYDKVKPAVDSISSPSTSDDI